MRNRLNSGKYFTVESMGNKVHTFRRKPLHWWRQECLKFSEIMGVLVQTHPRGRFLKNLPRVKWRVLEICLKSKDLGKGKDSIYEEFLRDLPQIRILSIIWQKINRVVQIFDNPRIVGQFTSFATFEMRLSSSWCTIGENQF